MMKSSGMPPLYPACTGVIPMPDYFINSDDMPCKNARVVCADGSTVSVQADVYCYCTPRNNEGPYTHVEAGFPTGKIPVAWKRYAEDKEDLYGTVYPYLPVYLVDKFINMHGGLVSGELPARHPCTLGVKSLAQLEKRIANAWETIDL